MNDNFAEAQGNKWVSVVYDPVRKELIPRAGLWGRIKDFFVPRYREVGTGKWYAVDANGKQIESSDGSTWS